MAKDIGYLISKAIKLNCFIAIEYKNGSGETTSFWCAVDDVLPNQVLKVTAYNRVRFKENVKEGMLIHFERIIDAELVEGTSYDYNDELIQKIENSNEFEWLHYDSTDLNILDYYQDCLKYDRTPTMEELHLLEGVDLDVLRKEHSFKLTNQQFVEVVEKIYRYNFLEAVKGDMFIYRDMCVNILSIHVNSKSIFPVAYQLVTLNLKKKCLELNDDIYINRDFIDDNIKYSLHHYLDVETENFITNFREDPYKYTRELQINLHRGETLDELPYFFFLRRDTFSFEEEYEEIRRRFQMKELATPLQAFFGNMSKKLQRGAMSKPITLVDEKVNMDQLRAIYNANRNPITYIQGPPGTGKTQTILNILLSAYFNKMSSLVCSNNNKPMNGILDKLQSFTYEGEPVFFPLLHIGNKNVNDEYLDYLYHTYQRLHERSVNIAYQGFDENSMHSLKELLEAYETRNDLEMRKEVIEQMLEEVEGFQTFALEAELDNVLMALKTCPQISDQDALNSLHINPDLNKVLYLEGVKCMHALDSKPYKSFLDIILMYDDEGKDREERRRAFGEYLRNEQNFKRLLKLFPIVVTTNLSSTKLPLSECFDYCVMDEAGQCSIAASLLPMLRAKRLVLVGDENQLEPVIVLDEKLNEKFMRKHHILPEYNYTKNSILRLLQVVDQISTFILLRSHYRCSKDIIEFSNHRYYEDQLMVLSENFEDSLELMKVESSNSLEKNTSVDEVLAIKSDIEAHEYSSVGVITPFHNQAVLLKDVLKDKADVDSGTVHTFQGDEKDVIYLSLALTPQTRDETYRWISNNRELINVASTRAKKKLVLVCDPAQIRKHERNDDLNSLVDYIEHKGSEVLSNADKQYANKIKSVKWLNSKAERAFIETITHYLSTHPTMQGQSKIKVSSILKKCAREDFNYFTRSEFDYVLFDQGIPIMAVEIDGLEHATNPYTMENDQKKKRICEENGIELVRIANSDVRMYEYIKDIIDDLIGG